MNAIARVLETKAGRGVAALTAAWFVAILVLILLGFADGELVCDDAYYYFEIARNAALGEGFTFDSLKPTNGFHPLWAWILVPVFWLFPGSIWPPIYVALMLAAAFIAGTALCIFSFFARRGRADAGLLGAAIWLLNPFTLVLGLRGMEGPLNTLLIALAFLCLDALRRRGDYTTGELVKLGVYAGLCLLARTDNVLLVAAISVVLAFDLAKRRAWLDLVRGGAIFGATAAAVTLPWCVWNLSTFGTVVQTSFRSKNMFSLYGQLPEWLPAQIDGIGDLTTLLLNALHNFVLIAEYNAKYMMGEEWAPIDLGNYLLYPLLLVGLGLAVVPHTHRRVRELFRKQRGGLAGALWPVGLFCLFHFGWYALIGLNYYNWYLLPPVLAFSLLCGRRLDLLWSLDTGLGRLAVAVVLAGLIGTGPLIVSGHVSGIEPHRGEEKFVASTGRWIEARPRGARLGIWNAGAAGYFASFHYPDRYVINLDGLVNNDVPAYARESSYEQYLLDRIDYLIESPLAMIRVVGVSRTERFAAEHLGPGFRVVRQMPGVDDPSAIPARNTAAAD